LLEPSERAKLAAQAVREGAAVQLPSLDILGTFFPLK
jgi:hypothetical protein